MAYDPLAYDARDLSTMIASAEAGIGQALVPTDEFLNDMLTALRHDSLRLRTGLRIRRGEFTFDSPLDTMGMTRCISYLLLKMWVGGGGFDLPDEQDYMKRIHLLMALYGLLTGAIYVIDPALRDRASSFPVPDGATFTDLMEHQFEVWFPHTGPLPEKDKECEVWLIYQPLPLRVELLQLRTGFDDGVTHYIFKNGRLLTMQSTNTISEDEEVNLYGDWERAGVATPAADWRQQRQVTRSLLAFRGSEYAELTAQHVRRTVLRDHGLLRGGHRTELQFVLLRRSLPSPRPEPAASVDVQWNWRWPVASYKRILRHPRYAKGGPLPRESTTKGHKKGPLDRPEKPGLYKVVR